LGGNFKKGEEKREKGKRLKIKVEKSDIKEIKTNSKVTNIKQNGWQIFNCLGLRRI
jgi:hypothetical protein